MTNTNTS